MPSAIAFLLERGVDVGRGVFDRLLSPTSDAGRKRAWWWRYDDRRALEKRWRRRTYHRRKERLLRLDELGRRE